MLQIFTWNVEAEKFAFYDGRTGAVFLHIQVHVLFASHTNISLGIAAAEAAADAHLILASSLLNIEGCDVWY